ncbi:MAG TPA: dienelactone hydrolase family protein [Longimicrobiaceae bacterium]|nr:dienelactone hydrolase family protein [Longimicrobiaceae bacterium]
MRTTSALRSIRPIAPVFVMLCCAASLTAQHAGHAGDPHTADPGSAAGLGTIHFPTRASPAAHAEFTRGVLLLHNFHYPHAVRAFQRARELDPRDAMSAAFEALAHTHPVWNQQDTAAARAALRSLAPTPAARARMARTPRERAWLRAVEALYAGDLPKAVRDTAFSRAMARLHTGDPADPEAATFYALSLLGLNQAEREPRAYAMAEEISRAVLRAHPHHPGALHYLIHAVDDPASAVRGIEAARVYGEIAPAAGHAQHMTSHIFIALGRWDDVVRANLRAYAAYSPDGRVFGHGTQWLAYGLIQQGRVREAHSWLDSMLTYQRDVAAGATPAVRGRADADAHAVLMTAAHVINAEAWDSPLARMRFDTTHLRSIDTRAVADFFVAYAAAQRARRAVDVTPGSREADRLLADSLLERIAARNVRARAAGARAGPLGEAEAMEKMLRAERFAIANQPDSALALLRAAAEQWESVPFMYGLPGTVKPPRERAAEILLVTRRPAEALAELERAERMAPGRSLARLYRARALLALGRRDEAVREYRELAATWRDADVTYPDREEARWGSTTLAAGSSDASVAVDTVAYASGELALRGTLYRPTAAGRHPALVVLHGSLGCWRQAERDNVGRLFAARGYVTFFPCRRGVGLSTGQGEAVTDQLQREGLTARDPAFARRSTELLTTTQLQDVRAAVAAIRACPDVDPKRVAVTGVSYGGILTMLAAEADPTLRAAVAFAPAAMNWGWNAPLRERLLAGARRVRVPVLVVQAENDWDLAPTRELPAAVRAGGGEGDGKLYPAIGANVGDGHGFMVLAPELWREDVLEFLDRQMKGRSRP